MRILVIGSNNANSRMVFSALDAINKEKKVERVFVGSSSAADRLAIMWAMSNDIPTSNAWDTRKTNLCLCFAPGANSAHYAQVAKAAGCEVTYYF